MLRAVRWFLEFMREIERGQAMMRGEIKPGTYERRLRRVRWCESGGFRGSQGHNRRHRARKQRRRPV